MDEYEYDEGSDIDNYEDEQVFQDDVADRKEQHPQLDPMTDALPTFLDHFELLARTMGITRK